MGINLDPHKTIRIAVSHDVFLNRLETLIIDTPEFQRLRRLKQLGSSDLVFPTALHNRFAHSLGALQMTNRMVRCIRENRHNTKEECNITDEQEQLIRLVALLHDIGHLPYGHTIEDEFNIFLRHDEDHERINRLIGRDSNIGKILRTSQFGIGENLYDLLFKILNTTKETQHELGEDLFIYDVVNNTVCADLLDYLLRDSYFCDLPVGLDYRFLNYLYLYEDEIKKPIPKEQAKNLSKPNGRLFEEPQEEYESVAETLSSNNENKNSEVETKSFKVKRTAIRLSNKTGDKPRPDLLNEMVALLEYRYKLGEIVYFHHAKLSSGSMIAGAVYRANRDKKIKLQELYEMGDEKLIYTLQTRYEKEGKGNNPVKKLVDCFEQRRLWKASSFRRTRPQIDKEQGEHTSIPIWKKIKANFYENPNYRYSIEADICKKFDFQDGDVLIHCPNPKMQSKVAQMNVFWQGEHRPLADCEYNELTKRKLNLILESHKELWSFRVFVNPSVFDKDASIETFFENELCYTPKRKQNKEKIALDDWLKYEIENKYDLEKISVPIYNKIKTEIAESVLVETYGEKTADNLRETVHKICNNNGITEKNAIKSA